LLFVITYHSSMHLAFLCRQC